MLRKNKILITSYAICIVLGVTLFLLGSRQSYIDLQEMKDKVDSLNMNLLNEDQQISQRYDKLVLYLYDNLYFQGESRISNSTINDCPKSEFEQQNLTNTTLHFNPIEQIRSIYPNNSFEVGLKSEKVLNFNQSLVSFFTGIDRKQLNQLLNYKQNEKVLFRNLISDIQQSSKLQTYAYLSKKYQDIIALFYENEKQSTDTKTTTSSSNKNFEVSGEINVSFNINQHIEKNDFDVLIFSKSNEKILIEENKESQLKDILEQKKTSLLSVMSQINRSQTNTLFIALGWNECHQQLKLFCFNKNGFSKQQLDSQELKIDKIYGSLSSSMNWNQPKGLIAKNSEIFNKKQESPNSQIELAQQIQDGYNTLIQQYKVLNQLVNISSSSPTKIDDTELLSNTLNKMNKIYQNYSENNESILSKLSAEDLKSIQFMQEEIEDKIKNYSQFNITFTTMGVFFIFITIFIAIVILIANMKNQDSIQSKRIINFVLEIPIYYAALKFLFNRLLIPEFSSSFSESYQKQIISQKIELQDETIFSILLFLGIIGLLNSMTLFIQQQYNKIFFAVVCYNLLIGEGYLQRQIFKNSTLADNSEQLVILLVIIVRFLYELYSTLGESLFYHYFGILLFLLPLLKYFFEPSFVFFQYINGINGVVLVYLNRSETNFEEKITIFLLSFSPFINFFISAKQCSNFFFLYSSHITLLCLLFCFASSLKILYLPAFFVIMNLINYELVMNLKISESQYNIGFSLNSYLIVGLALIGVATVIFWSKAQQMHKKNFNDLTLSKIFSSDVQSNQSVLIASLFKFNLFGIIALFHIMFFLLLQNSPYLQSLFEDYLENFLTGDHSNNYINLFQMQAIYTVASLIAGIFLLLMYQRSKKIEDFDSASKSQIYETEDIADNTASRKGFDIIMASEQKSLNNNSSIF